MTWAFGTILKKSTRAPWRCLRKRRNTATSPRCCGAASVTTLRWAPRKTTKRRLTFTPARRKRETPKRSGGWDIFTSTRRERLTTPRPPICGLNARQSRKTRWANSSLRRRRRKRNGVTANCLPCCPTATPPPCTPRDCAANTGSARKKTRKKRSCISPARRKRFSQCRCP